MDTSSIFARSYRAIREKRHFANVFLRSARHLSFPFIICTVICSAATAHYSPERRRKAKLNNSLDFFGQNMEPNAQSYFPLSICTSFPWRSGVGRIWNSCHAYLWTSTRHKRESAAVNRGEQEIGIKRKTSFLFLFWNFDDRNPAAAGDKMSHPRKRKVPLPRLHVQKIYKNVEKWSDTQYFSFFSRPKIAKWIPSCALTWGHFSGRGPQVFFFVL